MTVTTPSGDGEWVVDGVTFVFGFGMGSTADRFLIRKPSALFQRYIDLAGRFRAGRIVELGIAAGGSTALLSLLTEPRSLTACELSQEPVPALTELIEDRGLSSVVRPFYGIDQSDRVRLAETVESHVGAEPLDLVIDDASHRYQETLASFEVLFPRLRTGGWFIIEDWAADFAYAERIAAALSDSGPDAAALRHRLEEAVAPEGPRPTPLPRLGLELLVACGGSTGVISELTVDPHWIVVQRGPAPLAPGTFRLRDHCRDHWGLLAD